MTERSVIVRLCGSARFGPQFDMCYLEKTLAGRIVLSITTTPGGDAALFEGFSETEKNRIVTMLDELHLHKIDLADEVLRGGPHSLDSTRLVFNSIHEQGLGVNA